MTNYYFIIIFTHFCNEDCTVRRQRRVQKKRQTVHLKFVMYQAITFLTRNIYHGTTNHVVFKEREQQKMKYGCKKLCHTIFDDESTKKRKEYISQGNKTENIELNFIALVHTHTHTNPHFIDYTDNRHHHWHSEVCPYSSSSKKGVSNHRKLILT